MTIQQNTSIPEVQQTIVMLRKLNSDEQVQQDVFYREKRLHDEASALGSAKLEGRAERDIEIADTMRKKAIPRNRLRICLVAHNWAKFQRTQLPPKTV